MRRANRGLKVELQRALYRLGPLMRMAAAGKIRLDGPDAPPGPAELPDNRGSRGPIGPSVSARLRLVDSVVRGWPVGVITVLDRAGEHCVIDGRRRLTALVSTFLAGSGGVRVYCDLDSGGFSAGFRDPATGQSPLFPVDALLYTTAFREEIERGGYTAERADAAEALAGAVLGAEIDVLHVRECSIDEAVSLRRRLNAGMLAEREGTA